MNRASAVVFVVSVLVSGCSGTGSGNPDGAVGTGGGNGKGDAGGVSGPDGGNPPGSVITVVGTVGSPTVGAPNIPVYVIGQKMVYTTDSAGKFTIPNVTVPYDLFIGNGLTARSGTIYAGLSRSQILVPFGYNPPPTGVQGTIDLQINNMYPEPPVGTGLFLNSHYNQPPLTKISAGHYQLNTTILVPSLLSVMDQDCVDSQCTAVHFRYASFNITAGSISAGKLSTTLTLADVPTATVTFQGTSTCGNSLYLYDGAGPNYDWLTYFVQYSQSTFYLPEVPGAFFYATGCTDDKRLTFYGMDVMPVATTTITYPTAPPLPQQVSPGDTGTVSFPTNFRWNLGPGTSGLSVVHMNFNNPGGSVDLYIWTADTSYFIPDLSAVGIAFPTSHGDTWDIKQSLDAASTDDLLNPQWPTPAESFVASPLGDWRRGREARSAQAFTFSVN